MHSASWLSRSVVVASQAAFLLICSAALPVSAKPCPPKDVYDYIVVGSGPGGGVVASNLALAGHSVMLIEAGSDDSANLGTILPALQYPADPALKWSFFIQHHTDPEVEKKNRLLTWTLPNGDYWVGSADKAPQGAELNGIWYPRGASLGGSALVNAMASVLPNDADWVEIARLTGDQTWEPEQMRDIFVTVERNRYLKGNESTAGHGLDGFMNIGQGDSSFYQTQPGRLAFLGQLASDQAGEQLSEEQVLAQLERDANYLGASRDTAVGAFGLPTHTNNAGRRWSPRDLVLETVGAGHRLRLQLESLATKIIFDKTGASPRAVGVEYLEGKGVYKATWQYAKGTAPKGTLKRAFARKEVIISGGAINTPQILQLSGVGDAEHLKSLGIKVVADLPGVGRNLRDNQELPVAGLSPLNITTISRDPAWATCTRGAPGDPCFAAWQNGLGPYAAASGNSECAFLKTDHSPDGARDIITFAPPGVFRGFFPPTMQNDLGIFTDLPSTLWRSMSHMNVQSNAGYVKIKSRDPTDTPEVNIAMYEAPVGGDEDLGAMMDTVAWVRRNMAALPAPFGPVEDIIEPPCPSGWDRATGYCSNPDEDKEWIYEQTFGHHAVGTCKMGPASDKLAVLDSKFRVHGVKGLRVVDASIFPISPGGFPVLPTVMIGQKASDDILADA
ncbi:choline dehydrogenase [Microdochium nivale]|nr:choline dehydrogenase [Microdochium nivale]